MKPSAKICASIQFRLADQGLHVLSEDAALQEHLGECEECFDFLGALEAVDRSLETAPVHEPSEALIARTLERVRRLPRSEINPEQGEFGEPFRPLDFGMWAAQLRTALGRLFANPAGSKLAAGAIAAFALLLAVRVASHDANRPRSSSVARRPITSESVQQTEQYADLIPAFKQVLEAATHERKKTAERLDQTKAELDSHKNRVSGVFETLIDKFEALAREVDTLAAAMRSQQESIPVDSLAAAGPDELEAFGKEPAREYDHPPAVLPGQVAAGFGDGDESEGLTADEEQVKAMVANELVRKRMREGAEVLDEGRRQLKPQAAAERAAQPRRNSSAASTAEQSPSDGKDLQLDQQTAGKVSEATLEAGKNKKSAGDDYVDYAVESRGKGITMPQSTVQTTRVVGRDEVKREDNADLASGSKEGKSDFEHSQTKTEGQSVFRSLHDLKFKDPSGYWANTYLPGDPAVRRLQTTLRQVRDKSLATTNWELLSFPELAQYPTQPFDVPANAALGLQLAADRTGLEAPGRMLLQVGMRGTDRNAGRRPALNVAIVVDVAPGLSPDQQAQLQELLLAFNEAKDIGDRYRLFLTGSPIEIPPEDFRHGPLSLALANSFGNLQQTQSGTNTLEAVYTRALASVRSDDNPNAPLGSSSVLLVTNRDLSAEESVLTRLAHRAAVDGVQTSVVGFAGKLAGDAWEEIALSGQGTRHTVKSGDSIDELVAKEVSNVSRTIARAVRLRIRLAPGVQLVNVLGSYRLDELKAQQVRDAEKSVDRRIARNLGIQADRGEDEEGIQIVIPSFYAGDTHVVLLDVVAPGPGAIADVRIRYKDLVYLKNAVATANLSLGRSVSALGPLEQNVLKNYLAFRLAESLAGSSGQVRGGSGMPNIIAEHSRLLKEAVALAPGLERDAEIEADFRLLTHYRSVMQGFPQIGAEDTAVFADSLALAGKHKTLPLNTTATKTP